MKWFRSILLALLCICYCYVLNTKMGDIPPLGKLLSPFNGFWQNNESGKIAETELTITGLIAPVKVVMDNNMVPHIFARNNHDLYLAQGYIHAKYRLWQMEFQTHAAAGRISEIIGAKALPYDRQQRNFGMVYAAENAESNMMADPMMKEAGSAYTEGVNAYIKNLCSKDLPVEYKLLDYKPEPWTTLKCALLLKYMTYDLAGASSDLATSNILKQYGQTAIDSLFNGHAYLSEPIIPAGTTWDFVPLPIPAAPFQVISEVPAVKPDHTPNPDNGSNNWAVSGSKTASGSPILCGDPHLGLNLPSIWYQMQLVSPDCNATGVSLPGVPTVIIGFNDSIAWSETNVDADILDWYSVQFKDDTHKEYFYNNEWKQTTARIEVIKVRGEKDVVDTVFYTQHGPVVTMGDKKLMRTNFPVGYAMRWLGHDHSAELNTFLLLDRAKNYDDYVHAMSFFECPAQNFIYADAANNIAIWVNGKFPLKWKNQGKFLLDGSKPENDWQGWVPHDQDPHVKNPERGFVSSANQLSTDSTYPYYINWQMDAPMRAHRINQQLSGMSGITSEEMRILQYDNKNMVADFVITEMIAGVDETKLNDLQKQQFQLLKNWDLMANTNSTEQTVFNAWWINLKTVIWDDELGKEGLEYPSTDISLQTVKYNINKRWIDNVNTPEIETLQQLINQSYLSAIDSLQKKYGADTKDWQWAQVKNTHVNHLLHIPALSRIPVIAPGNSGIVNATGYDHGPSWRMIIELGNKVKAFGIYPGGQSGNPGSPFYENMIDPWSKGLQNELLILHDEQEKDSRIVSTITLSN
ncbi:MAG: penicillin acylase family protein [Chitinophagaceae bacterium]|nr:penicillin acylase family protein [Chitinophagaceae bacterium]